MITKGAAGGRWILIGGAAVSAWLLFAVAVAQGWISAGPLAEFGYMPPKLAAAPVALGALLLLVRGARRDLTGLGWGVLAAWAALTPLLFALRFNTPSVEQQDVRVMTLNVRLDNRDLPKAMELIAREKPDLIMLQEVKYDPDGASVAKRMLEALPGWSMHRGGSGVLLSRWKLSDLRAEPMTWNDHRKMISARVEAPKPFYAATMHWFLPQIRSGLRSSNLEAQAHDFDQTLRLVGGLPGPVLFGGDFNNPPTQERSRILSRRWQNAFDLTGNGPGLTFPSYLPAVRIDHVYACSEWEVLRSWVGPNVGSDHLPVFADVRWRR